MSGTNKFTDAAIEQVKHAIALDNQQNYQEAFAQYQQALETFMKAVKFEQLAPVRKQLEIKMLQYMDRAEQLKALLSSRTQPAAAPSTPTAGNAGAAATGTGAAGGGAGEAGGADGTEAEPAEDAETAKLKASLGGAVVTEKPDVKWDDVAGLETAKSSLKEAVILPVKFPQLFQGKRKPWQGILLYGPPGTGKSFLAKAVATEADSTFFSVSSSDLVSKWQGESEKLVRQLFAMARASKPAIIFIDEIDSLCGSRSEGEADSSRRIKTEFLVQMQGVGQNNKGVLVLAATNVPWEIDPAMRRRFEKRVYIPLPDMPARVHLFRNMLRENSDSLTEADFNELGQMSDGCSGSDVSVVCREALMQPLRKCQTATHWVKCDANWRTAQQLGPGAALPHLKPCPPGTPGAFEKKLYDIDDPKAVLPPQTCMDDFRHVMGGAMSTVATEELEQFIKWTEEFGQDGSV